MPIFNSLKIESVAFSCVAFLIKQGCNNKAIKQDMVRLYN